MPNRLTRTPDHPVPEMPAAAAVLVPLADLFMVAMLSRPPTGSLRSTWVTPATLLLCLPVAVLGGALAAVLLAVGLGRQAYLLLPAALLSLALGAGSGAVAAVGIGQRLARPAADDG